MIINIEPDGQIKFIHSDDFASLFAEGKATVKRASSVEPTDAGEWTADLAVTGGPVLGPFKLRSEALAAEVAWIERHVLGSCDDVESVE